MFLCPFVQGAFLSDEWVEILLKRIATGRTAEGRRLLPAKSLQWEIGITTIKTKPKEPLWGNVIHLTQKKNGFVHSLKVTR